MKHLPRLGSLTVDISCEELSALLKCDVPTLDAFAEHVERLVAVAEAAKALDHLGPDDSSGYALVPIEDLVALREALNAMEAK